MNVNTFLLVSIFLALYCKGFKLPITAYNSLSDKLFDYTSKRTQAIGQEHRHEIGAALQLNNDERKVDFYLRRLKRMEVIDFVIYILCNMHLVRLGTV